MWKFSGRNGRAMSEKWDTLQIDTPDGERQAVAPLIISASRATDIPAFHAEWFFRCLRQGYLPWVNPFNRQTQWVSFTQTRAVVFWTKNPLPIIPYLPELEQRGIGYYFHYTLNDYTAEKLEPGVPELERRIQAFQALSRLIGKARVIWRFDPLLLADTITVTDLLAKLQRVGAQVHPYTRQLVFSFADIARYAHVAKGLAETGIQAREFTAAEMGELAAGLSRLNRDWGLELATCAETADLAAYGIRHAACIDGSLLARLFPEDLVLSDYLGVPRQGGLFAGDLTAINRSRKDRGQRPACGCIRSKDIGRYNTCPHGCAYCYANHSAFRRKARGVETF